MCLSFGKGINSGPSPGSQDFTISGCPLACVCSPLVFSSKAEGKGRCEWRTCSVLSQGSLNEQGQLFTLEVLIPRICLLPLESKEHGSMAVQLIRSSWGYPNPELETALRCQVSSNRLFAGALLIWLMTRISWLGAYHCQRLLHNENRKLVCLESLCYRGVSRHNRTGALLWVGKRRIFRNWLCPSPTQAMERAGMWELAVAPEGTTCFLEIAGRDPSSCSLPQHMFPALGFGPVRKAWLEEKEFRRCPWSVWSCVSNVQGSWAPFFCCANREGRRGVEHNNVPCLW